MRAARCSSLGSAPIRSRAAFSGGVQLGSAGSIGAAYIRQLPFGSAGNSLTTGSAAISLATVTYQAQLADNVNLYVTGYTNQRATDPDTGKPTLGYGGMIGIGF